jgi:nicotinamide-nucleotide amidase
MVEKVEIICIGKELLMGKMLNVNAHWLAKRVTTLGLEVDRIVTVTDNVEVIAIAVREALQRKPRFIITTGGLGPTYDDKTVEGIAEGTSRELQLNDQALKQIAEKFREQKEGRKSEFSEEEYERYKQIMLEHEHGIYSPYFLRMATIPRGSRMVLNPILEFGGLCVILEVEGIALVALPGVPLQVNAIFEGLIVPLLKDAAGNVTFLETSLDLRGIGEGRLNPLIAQVMNENPRVYMKSNVRGDQIREGLELYLSTSDENPSTAKNNLNKAVTQISELIRENGGEIIPIKTAKAS